MQEIAEKARALQQRMDENAEMEKANLRAAAEQKHLEIERHAAELARHAASSIEAFKNSQLETAEREKQHRQAIVRQQAEQAKRLVDQQAARAIAALDMRDRQVDLQRRQQELLRQGAPPSSLGAASPAGQFTAGPTMASSAGLAPGLSSEAFWRPVGSGQSLGR